MTTKKKHCSSNCVASGWSAEFANIKAVKASSILSNYCLEKLHQWCMHACKGPHATLRMLFYQAIFYEQKMKVNCLISGPCLDSSGVLSNSLVGLSGPTNLSSRLVLFAFKKSCWLAWPYLYLRVMMGVPDPSSQLIFSPNSSSQFSQFFAIPARFRRTIPVPSYLWGPIPAPS